MLLTGRIGLSPAVMLGKSVVRGTRIPVQPIIRKLGEGATEADLLDAYPRLTREDLIGSFVVVQPGHIRISRKPRSRD